MQKLLEPIAFGQFLLPNRMVMSAMSRNRTPTGTPTALNAEYYAQRAGAGLVLSESTAVSREGLGWQGMPCIYDEEHVHGWRRVTDAVHERGGRMFLQLWHCGAASHPSTRGGELPLAPSAIRLAGTVRTPPAGRVPNTDARAMSLGDIACTVDDYRHAATSAMQAGFDGVEVHGGNGYLIDQFLRDSCNRRTDAYGGTAANRCRFLFEVVEAVCGVWGADRVGVRLSPASPSNYELRDSDPHALMLEAIDGLNRLGVLYLAMVEGSSNAMPPTHELPYGEYKRRFKGLYIANNGYTQARGEAALRSGDADLVSFGRPYIANPDLPLRFARNAALNVLDPQTLYLPDHRGYTDYPTLGDIA